MTAYEQLGFAVPEAVNQAANAMPAGGRVVSGYFAGQMAGMLYSGWRARKTAKENNERSISFQEELANKRNEFAEKKQEAEIVFLRECHEKGMNIQREAALQACNNRLLEDEFRKFCDTSWNTHFRPQINAVLEEMKHPNIDECGVPKIKLLLASTPVIVKGMDQKGSYAMFCDEFKEELIMKNNLSIDTLWLRSWERTCVSPMGDMINLHYVMQGIPTVIIFPVQRGNYLSIETATWGYQLGQNHMLMDKTFRIPKSEVSDERIRTMMIAAACYVDDCYRLLLHNSAPNSLYKIMGLLKNDGMTWELITSKYKGLISQTKEANKLLTVSENEITKLEKTIEL